LLLVGKASNENGAFPNVLDDGTANDEAASVDVPRATVSVLLVLVAALYWFVCDWIALNDTSPAPTSVIVVPDASTVATLVLLLLYVITPVLLLVGKASNENGAFPNVLDDGTANDESESVDVARATVSVLLVFVAALYWFVCGWAALNDTSPAPTRVIVVPDASTVATFVLLLLYVITPVLLLVGNVSNENGAFPNVLEDAT
jgi:hypothetical protein